MTDLLSRIISVLGKKIDSPEYERLIADLDEVPEPKGHQTVKVFRSFMLVAKEDRFCTAELKIGDCRCRLPVGVTMGDHRRDVQEKFGFNPLPAKDPMEQDRDHYELNDVVLSLEFDADEKLCGARVWHKPAFHVRNVRPGI